MEGRRTPSMELNKGRVEQLQKDFTIAQMSTASILTDLDTNLRLLLIMRKRDNLDVGGRDGRTTFYDIHM